MFNLKRAAELTRVLREPGGLQAVFTWRPFSITAFQLLRSLERTGLDPRTIIDGGANVGQFARAAAETFPAARILSFEPFSDVADELRRNLADRPQVRAVASALGSGGGRLRMFRNRCSLASSAFSIRGDARVRFPGLRELETVEVPVARLDTLLESESLDPPVLLKLDVQGSELAALRGAPKTLERVDWLVVETTFLPTYEGEPLFEEVTAFLREAGFCFRRPVDFLRDRAGEIVQMDALFLPANRYGAEGPA